MNAREEILTRIAHGILQQPDRDPDLVKVTSENASRTVANAQPIPWEYGRPTPMPDVTARFVERCRDYGAQVDQIPSADVPQAIASVLTAFGLDSVVLPSGLDPLWESAISQAGIRTFSDDPPLSNTELNDISGVVTAARTAIAETGTIVLNHASDQGRRALTLVPDFHLCVVTSDQIVSDVPEAVARLRPSVDAGRPLTWISGPSATSDIELQRVEGVHGPRTLVVIVAGSLGA